MLRSVFDDDHHAFRDAVREFLRRDVNPHLERFAAEKALDRDLWRSAGSQGLLGLCIPEDLGGAGADDYRFNAVLIEELARTTMALASSLSIHFDVVTPYLVDLGTPDQRSRWLPAAAKGETVLAIAMTEPSAGSDLAAIKTSAQRVDGGWLLNGSKTFITNGFSADVVVVAARTGEDRGARGISLLVVEEGMPGFSRGRKLDKVGQPEADTAELFFDSVLVPDANVLGDVGRGFVHMMERLPQERLGAAIANVAHAEQIFEETVAYAKERVAFGAAIGTFQHNKFLLADLATRLDVTQAYVDQCIDAHRRHQLTPIEAAKAKWWSAEVQNAVLDHCVQLYGGYGYMNEYRVARAWQDARVTKIWAGSNEIMKELIGRDLGLLMTTTSPEAGN